MKVTITYEYDPKYGDDMPYWASARGIYKCGACFMEAREKLLTALRNQPQEPIPPPEEVEI